MSGRRILITGGAGFVGYHLAQALSQDDADEVTLLDNLSRGAEDEDLRTFTERPNVSLAVGDLRDIGVWEQLEKGYDEVYHLAAVIGVKKVVEHPAEVIRTNALSTLHLLDWLVDGGGRKVLFSSTSEAYASTSTSTSSPCRRPRTCPCRSRINRSPQLLRRQQDLRRTGLDPLLPRPQNAVRDSQVSQRLRAEDG